MEVVLRKYGNSTVLALPPAALKEPGLKAGPSTIARGQAYTLHRGQDFR